ncbi:MAG: hypothetical protein M1819_006381 [Sarea resinae]|nr:MAG: hypothetical protein M1819_006381 [Sarea resinae]
MASPTHNYSIYAIPAYWVLSVLPHNYAIRTIKAANNGRWDNSNPRSSNWNASVQKSVPAATFARYERAEAAHKNGFENLPVFVGAVILGNMAKLPPATLNAVTGAYLVSRIVYTLAYINVEQRKYSLARTGIYLSGIFMCMYLIVRAGNVLF